MKSFVSAIVILALTVGVVAANMLYVGRILGELEEILDGLPISADDFNADSFGDEIEALWEKWDESVGIIALTTGYPDIDRADDAIIEAVQSYRNGDMDGFLTARIRASDAVARMKKLASVSFDSIF